jgi:hypothetical protein
MYVNAEYLNARLHIKNLRGIVTADDIRRWIENGEIKCFVSLLVFERFEAVLRERKVNSHDWKHTN